MSELFDKTAAFRSDKGYDRCIENRRVFDQERMRRVFNPRLREAGVDVAALDLQTAERRAREAAELLDQIDAEERLLAANRFLTQREREFHRQRLAHERAVAQFNCDNVRPEYAREWDLNDPAVLRKDRPIRQDVVVGADGADGATHTGSGPLEAALGTTAGGVLPDPTLGASSGQVFAGEDLVARERERLQREETRAALEEQIRGARSRAEAQRVQDLEDQLRELQVCEHLAQVERDFAAHRRAVAESVRRQQMDQAELDRLRREEDRMQADEEARRHNETFGGSRLMLEVPSAGVPAEYKGWTADEQRAHFANLARQRADEQRRRRAELEDRIVGEARELEVNRYLRLRDLEQQKERTRAMHALRTDLEGMGVEERAREIARLQASKNEIDDDFWKYFQKTSR